MTVTEPTIAPQRQPVLGLPDPGEKVPPLAWPTALLYVGSLALAGLEFYGLLVAGWSLWATVPMGAAVTFLMFSVLHESTHHAISTNTAPPMAPSSNTQRNNSASVMNEVLIVTTRKIGTFYDSTVYRHGLHG